MGKLIQIVPSLSPPSTGVGDYALGLARELRQNYSLDSSFLIGDPTWQIRTGKSPFPTSVIARRSPDCVAQTLEALSSCGREVSRSGQGCVLLHLSSYGFERNGCPIWLARGLRRWKRRNLDAKLITMFHELNASGPLLTKAFWLSPLQLMIVKDIAKTSDRAFTNTVAFQSRLASWTRDRRLPVQCLPTPSNVGEPTEMRQLAERRARAVIFGIRPGARGLSHDARVRLAQMLRALGILELCVVGDSPVPSAFDGLGCATVIMGLLSPEALSALLSDARLGLLSYPPVVLSKSGVFGAYCAHGLPTLLLPVAGDTRQPSGDGLQLNKHYMELDSSANEWTDALLQRLANRARQWYLPHRLSEHAAHVAKLMNDVTLAPDIH